MYHILECINPGDLVDKYSILLIKLVKYPEKIDDISEEIARISYLLDRLLEYYNSITEQLQSKMVFYLFSELCLINLKQWELEDRVRSEQTGTAAYNARVNNSKRIEIKNKINDLFNFPDEVKLYKNKGENK